MCSFARNKCFRVLVLISAFCVATITTHVLPDRGRARSPSTRAQQGLMALSLLVCASKNLLQEKLEIIPGTLPRQWKLSLNHFTPQVFNTVEPPNKGHITLWR